MPTPISMSQLSGMTLIYAYNFYGSTGGILSGTDQFTLVNTPTTNRKEIYIKNSGLYMAMLIFDFSYYDLSIVFYYDSATNRTYGMGGTANDANNTFLIAVAANAANTKIIAGGRNSGAGRQYTTFSIYRIGSLSIPSGYLCTGKSIPDGSGGSSTTTGGEYRNTDQ